MRFHADLHVHSKHSRATSRDGDLEHLALWARKKGILVAATGDFTHPAWFSEIEEKLVPAEPGLFRLRPDLEKNAYAGLCGPLGPPTRFQLEVEISTIYKRDGRTRKVHHLVYAPDMEKARKLTAGLARIGNVASDGRPILGLDSRTLLEMTLEAGEGCYLIPAHIWTPWFAVLGSMSGFDCIEECYGELSSAIFAVETGLSSDPPMNRRLSILDKYRLVSSSDAHSPAKIGREACVFDTELSFFSLRRALESGVGYEGTVEFYPEEGKYHYDGHRKCGVCFSPEESRRSLGVCPACGKPLTLGVMHRVCALADRAEAATSEAYRSFVPLEELLAEVRGTGPQSKAVQELYERLVQRLGSELFILESAPLEDIEKAGSRWVAEAVSRMREGKVIRQPGFDGEYGKIRLFREGELASLASRTSLFDFMRSVGSAENSRPGPLSGEEVAPRPCAGAPASAIPEAAAPPVALPEDAERPAPAGSLLGHLDPDQREAVMAAGAPLAILAGPGTGKTRTLTCRIARRILEGELEPEQCLAITFTNRAAREMVERLETLLGPAARRVPVKTFHSLGLSILREEGKRLGLPEPFRVAGEDESRSLLQEALSLTAARAGRLLEAISRKKRAGRGPGESNERPDVDAASAAHERALRERGLVDFDDLIALPVRLLEESRDLKDAYRRRYPSVSVDEFQDTDPLQYRLVRLLATPDGDLCVIGDPDQSIYGFRGADVECFRRFLLDFPSARAVQLATNYRSTGAIVAASLQVMAPETLVRDRRLLAKGEGPEHVEIHECATDRAEAELVVSTIERMMGGSTFFSMDSGRAEAGDTSRLSFGDFAVLFRTRALADPLVEAFHRSGMPFQKRAHESLADAPAVKVLLRELEALQAEAAAGLPLPELLDKAAARARGGAPEVDMYLQPLQALARRGGGDFPRLRSDLALGIDCDLWDPRAEAVSLLTIHAAKGLEFPVVFIVGCEDGILPLHRDAGAPGDPPEDPAEERRLFFVGMTRARRLLILTRARRRRWRGRTRASVASPFLADIPKMLQECERHEASKKAAPAYRQLTLFDDG